MQKLPLKKFFKSHRVVRWELRLIIIVILACILGMLTLPIWRDYKAIRNLGVGTYQEQREAINIAAARANTRPGMVKRLISALDTPNQQKFLAIHDILFHFQKFTPRHVPLIWIDRYNLIQMERFLETDKTAATKPSTQPAKTSNASAMALCTFIYDFIINGQDNQYVRRALELTHTSQLPKARQAAAGLAARLGDDVTLKKLLADPDPQVATEAALGVYVANRSGCLNDVAARFNRALNEKPINADLVTACALTMVNMQVQTLDLKKIVRLAVDANDEIMQEKLALVLPLISDQDTCDTVTGYFEKCSAAGKCPNAMMLLAGAKMKLPAAPSIAKKILADAIDPAKASGMMQAHIIAAIQTLDHTGVPCRKEIYDFVKTYWQPERHLMLIPAARLLGEQAITAAQPAGAPTKEQCAELLRQAATWMRQDDKGNFRNTPLASAGAAVAAWLVDPAHIEFIISSGENPDMETMKVEYTSAFLVREVVTNEQALPGDYVAWNIGMTHSTEAYALGQWMLPNNGARVELNPNVRAAGALLLGFATDSANERVEAESKIELRIKSEDFLAKGSCQCALLSLWPGREVLREQVLNLLWIPDFPRRRIWTALMCAGDKTVLDSLLLNPSVKLRELADSFVLKEMNEVFSILAPSLTTPSVPADESTRELQMRIMRMQWMCNRNSMTYGLQMQ